MTVNDARALCEAALDQLAATLPTPRVLAAIAEVRPRYSIEFNRRFTARMGDANYRRMRIRLSRPLWPYASEDEHLETITHELAHLVSAAIAGRRTGHDLQWKAIHRAMGGTGKRCHNVKRPENMRRKRSGVWHAWTCECHEYRVSPQRHGRYKRALQPGGRLQCRLCRQTLRYLGRVDDNARAVAQGSES